jgi:hypothetical protein
MGIVVRDPDIESMHSRIRRRDGQRRLGKDAIEALRIGWSIGRGNPRMNQEQTQDQDELTQGGILWLRRLVQRLAVAVCGSALLSSSL